MKTLSQFIIESLIDIDNLNYKVDIWTNRQENVKNIIKELVNIYSKKKFVDIKLIDKYIEDGKISKFEIECFVNFVCDNVIRQCDDHQEVNYMYTFSKIIQLIAQQQINI